MKNIKNAIDHLNMHQKYPATRQELVDACNELSDFSADDKKWFESHLPQGTYDSAQAVMQALGMDSKSAGMQA